ncbi:hypothetical protein PHLGIDRAFT_374536 [Phlebiopsis gigantea 11061_1 CR5-6]|uniref:Uncharacterized protein n=1 Tax=Phlebiopsis gigantea (strain 11061_1 CR5-6) TaxID=745531 RepID=A0A0C3RPA9_PHLG1|nr:hypothetical protein PHLGIDRAFT_374536 [Phlebiopsis gigantea 11061_1 CR5-6]
MSKSSLLPIRMGSMNNPTRVWSWSHKHTTFGVTLGALLLATGLWILDGVHKPRMTTFAPFYHSVRTHDDLCVGGVSHSGYVGLQGDAKDAPRRSFFWYFEAQNSPETAPVILTIGGGPGSSGMAHQETQICYVARAFATPATRRRSIKPLIRSLRSLP